MPRVLVVDDSEMDREIVSRILGKDSSLQLEMANDGARALDLIEKQPPELVLTDLRMPKVDGLQLVESVRNGHAEIPIILMTAHGSEEIAIEALRRGAASYVPKAQLAKRLLMTVNDVLLLSQASRSNRRLINCLTHTTFHFQLDNDPQLIPALVDLLQQMLAGVQLCDANSRVRIAVALEEALSNALYHGNLEISREELAAPSATPLADLRRRQPPYCHRQIHVLADISASQARFVIRDEGTGFDLTDIPDPQNAENVERFAGRGLMLMQTFMDEVRFNDAGNEVTLEVQVLKRESAPQQFAAEPDGSTLFRFSQQGDVLVVMPLRGISSLAEEKVQEELAGLFHRTDADHIRHVVFDLSRVDYFGSSMLEAMRIIWKQIRENDGQLGICHLSSVAREIVHLARFDEIFVVGDAVSDTISAVRTVSSKD